MNNGNTSGFETLETSFEAIGQKWGVDIYPLEINKISPNQSMRLKCQVPLSMHAPRMQTE